ncbi:MAG: hypothetical protein WCJ04_02135 [Actinomycetes bacterium]
MTEKSQVENSVTDLSVRYGQIDFDYGLRLATTSEEEDGPVWMVNLMRYRATAQYSDGRDSTLSGREADDVYAPIESLAAVGAEVVFFGDVETQLLGDLPPWDRVAVVKYPTRRSFMDMQERKEFKDQHHHKDAGMEATIILGCQPFAHPAAPEDLAEPAQVPHPSTADDPAVMVVHVIAFDRAESELEQSIEHMTAYQDHAVRIGVANGVQIAGWFNVEGTIIGDGRQWDQVRFNAFPSRAAFMAVVTDPERLAVQAEHRETAMSDTYTMIVRPLINNIGASYADALLSDGEDL